MPNLGTPSNIAVRIKVRTLINPENALHSSVPYSLAHSAVIDDFGMKIDLLCNFERCLVDRR